MSSEPVTLTDKHTRPMDMKQMVSTAVAAITTDHRADELLKRVVDCRRHLHDYSARNRILMALQRDSRCIASLGAYEKMAAEQGAAAVSIGGKRRRLLIKAGSKAVWIWGRHTHERSIQDDLNDAGRRTEVQVSYSPVSVWACEDLIYAATYEDFALPDHIIPIDDDTLFRGLLAFAAHKKITVQERGLLNGPRGLSSGGRITLQVGDSPALQLPVLCHELAHELLHHRPGADRMPRGVIEGEAEIGGAAILLAHGLDTPMSAAYCRNWGLESHDLLQSIERVTAAVTEVTSWLSQWNREREQ